MEWNEKNLPLAKWLIDKTNTKDYRIGNLSGMKHPKVDGDLLKTVGGRDELVRQAKVLERIPALGGKEYLHFDWREMNTDITRIDYRVEVIPRLCELIGIMDPRECQLQAISRICKLQVDVYESCLSAYCDHVLEQLNKGELIVQRMTLEEKRNLFDFMDLIFANFISRLNSNYTLTKTDLILATLLKVGFTTNQLMFVFDCERNSVYRMKLRLKEHLCIDKEESLEEFILFF